MKDRREHRGRPDIDVTSTVKAEKLRFGEVPRIRIAFSGYPGHDSASESRRTGLPDRVEENVTYTHVRVDHRIRAALVERPNGTDAEDERRS